MPTDLRSALKAQAPAPRRPLDVDSLLERARASERRRRLRRWIAALTASAGVLVPVGASLVPADHGREGVRTVGHTTTTLASAPSLKTSHPPAVAAPAGQRSTKGEGVATSPSVGLQRSAHQTPTAATTGASGRIAYAGPDGKIYIREVNGATRAVATGFDPRWSPDGHRLLFWSGTGDTATCDNTGSTGRCTAEVDVVNADGSGQRTLVTRALQPDWSPDGTRITYLVAGPQVTVATVWIADADGTHPRQLTQGDDRYPRWSPDGTSIAFGHVVNDGTTTYDVVDVIHVDGSRLTTVAGSMDLSADSPAWSPDSKKLAFVGYGYGANHMDIYVLDLTSYDGATQITHDPAGKAYIDNMDYAPAWSADGQHIAYTFDPDGASGVYWCDAGPTTGCPVGGSQPGTIYEANSDGSSRHAVATGSFPDYDHR
jgi:hypothetical protein